MIEGQGNARVRASLPKSNPQNPLARSPPAVLDVPPMASENRPQKTPFWKSQFRPNRPAPAARSARPDRRDRPGPASHSPAADLDAGPAGPAGPERRPSRPARPTPFDRPQRYDRPDRPGRPFQKNFPTSDRPRSRPAYSAAPTGEAVPPGRPNRPARPPFKPRPRPDFYRESSAATAPGISAPQPEVRRSYKPKPKPKPKFELQPSPEDASDALPTVYLNPGEADRVVSGHPWVYEGSVLRLTREPADGDVVQVKDHRRRLLGVGFYNSQSRIRVRVLHPERIEIDEAFFEQRIAAAIAHRKRFMPEATSFRVINAEGDRLSGLIVDKYEDVLVLQTSSVGMDRRKATLVRVLEKLLQPRAILERNDMGARKFEGLPEANGILAGTLADTEEAAFPIRLNGLRFEVNLRSGHKTGVYLDQQINHALVAPLARDARVLDAFTFLGGFAQCAAQAGAKSVIGVDQSEDSIATARRLAETNGLASRCSFETGNVFDWLRTRTAHDPATATGTDPAPPAFDLVVLDPPSFTRNRASIPDALRGYKEIHLRALKLLAPGGTLATFCCSHHVDAVTFEAAILEAAFDARKTLRRIAAYSQSPDHPILPAIPESEYLKGYAYEVLP